MLFPEPETAMASTIVAAAGRRLPPEKLMQPAAS
jgi:hypothetical protein